MLNDEVTVWRVGADGAQAALRTILAAAAGVEPDQLKFESGPHGKPALKDGPHFNVSHSGAWALIAVCESAPIGVDIEVLPGRDNFESAARWAFTTREQRMLAELPTVERAEAFCQIWVVKEACVKQHGRGVPLMPKIETRGARGPLVSARLERQHEWAVSTWQPCPGYHAAVALSDSRARRHRDPTLLDFQQPPTGPGRATKTKPTT